MKKIYQKILRACAPFEVVVDFAISLIPVIAAFELIRTYPMQSDTAFMFGIFFYMFYRPYQRTLKKWSDEI